MTKKRLVLLLALVMLLAGAVQTFAADTEKEPKAPKEKPMAMNEKGGAEEGNFGVVEKLGLTDEQKTKIKGILEATKEERRTALMARMEAGKKLMQDALSGASDADIQTAATEFGKAAGAHAMAVSKTWGQIKPILTTEQQAKLKELIAEKKAEVKEKVAERKAERKAERIQKSTGETAK
jgi:Spy/CpxP family protein refolding chaperone